MSIRYLNIAKAVLLRTNQLGDAVDAAALETLYLNNDLAASTEGTDIPLSALKQQVLASEKRLAAFVARLKNTFMRRSLYGRSADIAHKGLIPATDQNGYQWIGNPASIIDSTTGEILTEKPKQEVRRLVRLKANGFLTVPVYHYAVEDDRLLHTVTNAYIEGCSWDYAIQSAAYDLPASGPADFTFVAGDVSTINDTITETAHGLSTGQRVQFPVATSPSGLYYASLPFFYAIRNSANVLQFGNSLANALAGSQINILTTGSGTMQCDVYPESGGYSPLAQELEVMFAADVLANLSMEDFFVNEAGRYAGIVEKCEADLLQGLVPQAVLPDTTANQEPVKN